MIARTLLLAAGLLGGVAHAAESEFRDIVWPHHDVDSGFLDWSLQAKTARSSGGNRFVCSDVEITTYRLVEEQSRKRARKDMYLRADKGTYERGLREVPKGALAPTDRTGTRPRMEQTTALLTGNVRAMLFGGDPLRITVQDADAVVTVKSAAFANIRERSVATASAVTLRGTTRTLTGTGMTMEDRNRAGIPQRSVLTLDRDVVVTLAGEGAEVPFPTIPGSATPAAPNGSPVPATISGRSKLVYDRLKNIARLERDVRVVRAETTLRSEELDLTFEETKVGGKSETKLKKMLAEKDVTITAGDQRFAGRRFTWDPAAASGRLEGTPATMNAPTANGTADAIEFDQENQLIRYLGNASVWLELKPE